MNRHLKTALFGLTALVLITPAVLAMTDHVNNDTSKTQEVFIRNSDQGYKYAALAVAPVATPTDFIVIQGSANRFVLVRRIVLSGVATAAGNMPVQLIRRSAADTTSCVLTPVTAAKLAVPNAAPVAVVSTVGTANCGSLGTSAGVIGAGRLQLSASGTGVAVNPLTWDFGFRLDQKLQLRTASEFLVINLNGAAVPAGGVIDFDIELEEYL